MIRIYRGSFFVCAWLTKKKKKIIWFIFYLFIMPVAWFDRCESCGYLYRNTEHTCPPWATNNLAKYLGFTEPRQEKGRKKARNEPMVECNNCKKIMRRCDVNKHLKRKPQCQNVVTQQENAKVCLFVVYNVLFVSFFMLSDHFLGKQWNQWKRNWK